MNTSPSLPLDLAITGVAGYAATYLKLLDRLPEGLARLRAVTDIHRAEHPDIRADLESDGVEVFTDYGDMMDAWGNRIDLCVLPVPIHLHPPMTRRALDAGTRVLLEKPLAGSVADGEAIVRADRDAEGRVAVGYQDLYASSTHHIARDLKNGRIGKIADVRMRAFWPRGERYYGRNRWAGRLTVDGAEVRDSPINNATAHFVNLALFFAGVPLGAMARAERVEAELFRCRDIESFDTAALRVHTDAGVPLHLYASHSVKEHENARLEVRGETGRLVWTQGETAHWEVDGRETIEPLEPHAEVKRAALVSVLESVRARAPFHCTPGMALEHVRLVELLHGAHTVRRVPDSRLGTHGPDGDPHLHLPGLEEDLKRCYDTASLPSELGFDWAR